MSWLTVLVAVFTSIRWAHHRLRGPLSDYLRRAQPEQRRYLSLRRTRRPDEHRPASRAADGQRRPHPDPRPARRQPRHRRRRRFRLPRNRPARLPPPRRRRQRRKRDLRYRRLRSGGTAADAVAERHSHPSARAHANADSGTYALPISRQRHADSPPPCRSPGNGRGCAIRWNLPPAAVVVFANAALPLSLEPLLRRALAGGGSRQCAVPSPPSISHPFPLCCKR